MMMFVDTVNLVMLIWCLFSLLFARTRIHKLKYFKMLVN